MECSYVNKQQSYTSIFRVIFCPWPCRITVEFHFKNSSSYELTSHGQTFRRMRGQLILDICILICSTLYTYLLATYSLLNTGLCYILRHQSNNYVILHPPKNIYVTSSSQSATDISVMIIYFYTTAKRALCVYFYSTFAAFGVRAAEPFASRITTNTMYLVTNKQRYNDVYRVFVCPKVK